MKEKFTKCWLDTYSEQMNVRVGKKNEMEKLGKNPYKNGYTPTNYAKDLQNDFSELTKEELEQKDIEVSIAGRVMTLRKFGKASFLTLQDSSGQIQVYVRKGDVSSEGLEEFKFLDYGDIIYVEGKVFKTNKGELTVNASEFKLLTKSLRPLPEKFHGMTDAELRYRLRYVDLIVSPEAKNRLHLRSKIINEMRSFFINENFLEVETPMLHSVAGGASAKPFKTFHNALDLPMSLRIAPELHLKRLIVGGMDKVFELNRCFRNEGLSLKHNPEFTSIEFYQAYATYYDLMDLTEKLLKTLVNFVTGSNLLVYQERKIDFSKSFKRISLVDSLSEFGGLEKEKIEDFDYLKAALLKNGHDKKDLESSSVDKLHCLCFDDFVEAKLVDPTFITQYPTEVSPLSRRNDENSRYVDRFELFINGWEIANAFSELNNPQDQLDRFADQAVLKESGDEEACEVDYDFVRALEYGMPPTAGEGIGIDRLCMLLTDAKTIRDVILFPQLKKENFF